MLQLDNANLGKYGNTSGRTIVQDAWVGWAPTGTSGPNVLFIDAGILLIPISRHLLESTTNFITADVHTDSFRLTGNQFPGLRETGVQVRGWWFGKKIGFRGGVYEGTRAINVAGADRSSLPRIPGFVNFDVLGSEEGQPPQRRGGAQPRPVRLRSAEHHHRRRRVRPQGHHHGSWGRRRS